MPLHLDRLISPRAFLWALRFAWVALAVLLWQAISQAAAGRTGAAGAVGAVAWGVAVAVVVVALVVPSALSLTVVRIVAPAAVPAAVLALASGAGSGWGVAALAVALLVAFVALSAEAGEALVQGSAYGDEQRFPLRPPASLLLPMAFTWLLWCAATLAGMVLLCARQWVLGAVLVAAGGGVGWLLLRSSHRLSRRWLVLVPAGVVLHDHVVLGETLMVLRANLALARLALADTEAADLTGPAAGHAVEVSVREMVLGVLASTAAEPKGKAMHMQSFLVAPSRPGRALAAAAQRKLPVG